MVALSPDLAPEPRARLRALAECELARVGRSAALPAELNARYQSDQAVTRSQELLRLARFGPIAYFVGHVLVYLFVNPEPHPWYCWVKLFLLPPLMYFAVRRWSAPATPPLLREGVVLGLCCLVVLGDIQDIFDSSPDVATMNTFLISSTVIGCMFFTRMTPIQALLFVVFSAICVGFVSLGRSDVPAQLRLYPLSSLLTSTIFALIALRELNAALRRVYLHALLQTLRIDDLADENRTLDLLSATDPLTGTSNRRGFEKILSKHPPAREDGNFLLLIDVDYFKQLNDRFGHPTGDAGLKAVAAIMRGLLGPRDHLARIGGDEFAVLLVDSTRLEARRYSERICERIRQQGFEAEGRHHSLSVTIGGAGWDPSMDAKQLVAAADAALYEAKRGGRGRVAWTSPDGQISAPGATSVLAA
jgi:diguanylate cyclase (GGDEF)-like protein